MTEKSMTTNMNIAEAADQYSIRQLSEISGVNAITLRAWERRYGLLKPQRTPKGHRYYTADDIETVRNILNWLDRGVAISKVKPLLSTDQLNSEQNSASNHWQETINHSLELINQFQREKLEQQINELFGNYPLDTLAINYFSPLRDALDRQAKLRFGGSAEKIFFDSELHADLLSRIRHANSNNNGERLLLLAFDGQQHGIQALLLALALLEAGFRLHLLFEACNLREIPYIIEQSQTASGSAIKTVICHSDSKPEIAALEAELTRAADHARIPFFVSGEWLNITPALKNIDGITALKDSLRTAIATVSQSLRKTA
jgi:DNA-binding transcriptional MerR regulator